MTFFQINGRRAENLEHVDELTEYIFIISSF